MELVYFGIQKLCAHFMDEILKACDEVFVKKRCRRSKEYTWCCKKR